MRTSTKIWLIVATAFLLAGCILFTGVMTALDWDFSKLSTVEYETNTYTITEPFTHISIDANTADVTFEVSQDDRVSVVCYEPKDDAHIVGVDKNMLMIHTKGARKWYRHIGINFQTPRITVYLPAGTYGALTVTTDTGDVSLPMDFTFASMDISVTTGDVSSFATVDGAANIRTTTGDILLKGFEAGSIDLSASTGDISVKNVSTDHLRMAVTTGETAVSGVRCRQFTAIGTTGDLFMRDLLVEGALSIERDTGDVHFDACDAGSMKITTDTGDVLGTLLTQKVFVTHTDTGYVRLPHTAPSGAPCEITTDTGNIHITLV